VTDANNKRRFLSITARPTLEEKEHFAWLADSRGISESQLALLAIRVLIDSSPTTSRIPAHHVHVGATDRITVRVRPGDGKAIAARAERRGLMPSAYIAALVRAHVAANPPLAADELQALKEAVAQLTAVGGVLRQVAQAALATGELSNNLRQELGKERAVVGLLERRVHDLVQKSLISWETNYG
jgi:hypothetical protein